MVIINRSNTHEIHKVQGHIPTDRRGVANRNRHILDASAQKPRIRTSILTSQNLKMKVSAFALFSLAALGHANAKSQLRKNGADNVESFEEESKWFARFVQEVDSLATPPPTPGPTLPPTPAPVVPPTPAPVVPPTPAPVVPPTPAPVVPPTPAPVVPPTPAPVVPPTPAPVVPPTPAPVVPPTPAPVVPPTPAPVVPPTPAPVVPPTPAPFETPMPSADPTGSCGAVVELNCTYVDPETGIVTDCEELPPIDSLVCTCPECVREVVFMYTGNACDGLADCIDTAGAPGAGTITFSPCDTDIVAFTGTVAAGDMITIGSPEGECLPDCMDVTVVGATSTQTFKIDSSCDDNGLVLKDSYGAIDFEGYSCDTGDINNCLQEIIYGIDACNFGTDELTLYELLFYFNGETTDLLGEGNTPILPPGECYDAVFNEFADRCMESEYCANVTMNSTMPNGGPICEDQDEIKFVIPASTLPPTPGPTLPPVPGPTPPPVPGPTPPPVPGPTPPPVPPPTPAPIPGTPAPVTPAPVTPAPILTPAPVTPAPIPGTPAPVTPSPTPPPASPAPTSGSCSAEVSFNCTYTLDGVEASCETLPPIDTPFCTCPEGCVKELQFVYTGNFCQGTPDDCSNIGAALPSPALVTITNCEDGSGQVLYSESQVPGDIIAIPAGALCLPSCMAVSIANPAAPDAVGQTFTLDTSCANRELVLTESYGALDFVGYSCDANDVNNCLQEIVYGIEACNVGTNDLTLYDLLFYFNGETTELIGEDLPLGAGQCAEEVVVEFANRCQTMEYCAEITMNATNPITGEPVCEDTEEIKFNITVNTLPPTPAPSPAPSPSSPAPTGSCDLNVVVVPECPIIECAFDRCRERPYRMLFRVEARPCADSILRRCPGQDPDSCSCIRNVTIDESGWPDQKFTCSDFNGGPIVGSTGPYYVKAYGQKDLEMYFEGPVELPGGRFNASTVNDEVEANSFLELYEYDAATGQPGLMLQQVLFHSSCSQQLYLLDIFGSFQLIEFESTNNGIVGFGVAPTVGFEISLGIEGQALSLDFLYIVVLSNTTGLIQPQVIEIPIPPPPENGVSESQPFTAQTQIVLIPGEDFSVITNIGATYESGIGCYDVSESVIKCDATVEPTIIEDRAVDGTGAPVEVP